MKKINIRASLARLTGWMRRHKLISALTLLAILTLVAGLVFALTRPESAPAKIIRTVTKQAPEPKYYSPLTGKLVDTEAATKQAVTAIMLENSPDARPQSGLKQAGVVYEAIAEGGITRFLALYQQEKPEIVGPVRSLRMYYVDWLAPYNASVAHVGGSKAALDEVRGGSYRDIDQFFNGDSYWRASDRYAPHNVYTNFEKLDALNAAKGYTESSFESFPRKDAKASETPNATSISINVSGPTYNSTYAYDAPSNSYLRSQGGAPHLDREDGQIQPNVVVALKVNMRRVQEDGYREAIETIGTGSAVIFQNGTAQEVTWIKPSRAESIQFTDSEGKPVPLTRGQTWITAVPNVGGGVAWQ